MDDKRKLELLKKKLAKKLKDRKILVKEKEQLDKDILKYETENKLMFFGHDGKGYLGAKGTWEENRVQKKFLKALKEKRFKTFVLVGANRISKTFSTSGIVVCLALRGCFPWEDPKIVGQWFWEMRGWKAPIYITIVGQDWENQIKKVIIPAIKELIPQSWNPKPKKNSLGAEANWEVTTDLGHTGYISVMSNKSESGVFEGAKGHVVIYDEPPKRDIRVACARGLIDYKGIEFFAMTLLKEAWVDRDVIKARNEDGSPDTSIFSVTGDILDNLGHGIDQEGIDDFSKKINPEEKEARLRGIPAYKSGLCLQIDRVIHYIPRFEIPTHWIIDIAIDIGVAKPHDILFKAIAENGLQYVCHAINIRGDGTAIADAIIKKVDRYHMRVNRIICDPLAKADQNNENSTWEKIEIHLARFGYVLEAGSKDKEDGIIAINNHLYTVNKMAALFIFKDLVTVCEQLEDWMRGDDGKPSKEKDDYCENLYRLMLLATEYVEDFLGEEDDWEDDSEKYKDNIAGY